MIARRHLLGTAAACAAMMPSRSLRAQAYASPPAAVQSVVPVANADGTVSTTTTMTDGTTNTQTTGPINVINVTGYLPNSTSPAPLTLTNGGTLALPDGYGVYNLSGSGLIAASTVKLPPNPKNGQYCRLVLPTGLTITLLTIQSGAGVAVGTIAAAAFGSLGLLYQWQGSAWVRVG